MASFARTASAPNHEKTFSELRQYSVFVVLVLLFQQNFKQKQSDCLRTLRRLKHVSTHLFFLTGDKRS